MIEQCKNLSKKDKAFLALASRIAEESSCEQRHGAVIVKSGSVISIGFNKWRNVCPRFPIREEDAEFLSTHAEMDALSKIRNARGVTIYIARINKNGKIKFSRPCDSCYMQLLKAGVKRVVFSIDDDI